MPFYGGITKRRRLKKVENTKFYLHRMFWWKRNVHVKLSVAVHFGRNISIFLRFDEFISFTLPLPLKSLKKLYNKTSCYSYHWKDLRRLWFLTEKLSIKNLCAYLIKANHNINRNYFHIIWIQLQNLLFNCIFWSYQSDFGKKIKIILRLFSIKKW